MEFGIVIGTLVASIKDPNLIGALLLIVQPIDEYGNKSGNPLVVADPDRNAGIGDVILFVHSPDASMAFPDDIWAPVDAAVVGIVDQATVRGQVLLWNGMKIEFDSIEVEWKSAE
jgi:microcompartment protein CcmK/EutM